MILRFKRPFSYWSMMTTIRRKICSLPVGPERWAPTGSTTGDLASGTDGIEAANAWVSDRETRQYTANASNAEWHWLRYRHYVPSEKDWDNADNGRPIQAPSPQASLVSDYLCFLTLPNANGIGRGSRFDSFMSNSYWVGDLTINCSVNVTSIAEKTSNPAGTCRRCRLFWMRFLSA